MFKILIYTVISVFLLSNCKKFEEDEGLQLLTVRNRMSSRFTWNSVRYSVDGVEKDKSLFSLSFRGERKRFMIVDVYLHAAPGYGVGYSGFYDQERGYPSDYRIYQGKGYLTTKSKIEILDAFYEIKSLTKKRMVLELQSFDGEFSSTERIELELED